MKPAVLLVGVISLGFFLKGNPAGGQTVPDPGRLYTLTDSSQFLIDTTAALSFAQVRGMVFAPVRPGALRSARWHHAIWLRTVMTNPGTLPSSWVLHTGKASFVDAYIRPPGGVFSRQKSGYYRTNTERAETRGKENSVHVVLLPGTTQVYVRYENQVKILPAPRLVLQPTASWNEHIIERNLYEGIAQGVLVVLFLYNILLYITLKRHTYLYYSLYILSLAVFYLNVYNLGRELVLGDFPKIFDYNWATLQIVMIFLLLFISDFLETRRRFPRIHANIRFLIAANIAWAVSGVAYLYFTRNLGVIFTIHRYFNLLQFLNFVVLLGILWRSRTRLVRRLVASTLLLFLGGLWDVLFRDASDVTQVHINYFQVGAILQLILFSLCIGAKLKDEERRRRRAHEKLIGQLRENQQLKDKINVALERKVTERTTALQAANAELSVLNREKARLISIIAHDLNSPLNALKGLLYIFDNDLMSQDELKRLIPEVGKDVTYITGLFNNLLAWARNQMEGTTVQPRDIDLQAITDETVQLLGTQAGHKGIRLSNQVEPQIKIHADEEMIKLVIRNLVSNAIKFTPEQGQISVRAGRRGTLVEVAVQDNGRGIDLESRQKLFVNELFTQRGTHNEKGSGLGLVLCKDFVERNGGTIWVESEPGQGSTFYFTVAASLPAKQLAPTWA